MKFMAFKQWTPTYIFHYALIKIGVRFYYKSYKVIGKENIPTNKPIFYVANHQNSLVDPVVIATSLTKPVSFLTRADVFKKPAIAKFFYSLHMLPIYRALDGEGWQQKNVAIFNECYDRLGKGRGIIIFPEGKHDYHKYIRELKSGVARIAMGAKEKYPDIDIQFVPVGLNFNSTVSKTAHLLVNYGEPIALNKYNGIEKDSDRTNAIMTDLTNQLKELTIHFDSKPYYNLYDYLFYKTKLIKGSIVERFKLRKEKTAMLEDFILNNEEETKVYLEDVNEINEYCEQEKIRPHLFNKAKHNVFLDVLLLIVGFPFFTNGFFNNAIPYFLPSVINKKIKDNQFYSPVNLVAGSYFCLIFWTIQTVLMAIFTDNYLWLVYLIWLPISGTIAFRYYILWKKFKGKLTYNKLAKKQSAIFASVKEKHTKLVDLLKSI